MLKRIRKMKDIKFKSIKKNCLKCGEEFKVPKCLERVKYCCRECYWEDKKGKNFISKKGREKLRQLAIKNQLGGARYGEENGFYKRHHTKETKLKLRMIAILRIGEKASNWQGGKTKIMDLLKNSDRYKQWRNNVFLRDNFTCQECGNKKSGNLEADHIKPKCNYPELIFDINNGRTLCKECHIKTETWGVKALCH